ncbi:hypothetical protein [Deinococcus aquatilis]|uniref:hypothetical protein n=1 Tax=Deinococcus aquatilis TaxID=519440 RepID=UPI000363834E|nr:hypothetical protein [Deinococcus aquatilis]
MLFKPEPRSPRTYAEKCLDWALASCHPGVTWAMLSERGATDYELRWYVAEFCFGLEKASSGKPHDEWLRFECAGYANPYLFAIRPEELFPSGGFDRTRGPDFQGVPLLNTVRELRGIWRPL